jgi:hypothetical protein
MTKPINPTMFPRGSKSAKRGKGMVSTIIFSIIAETEKKTEILISGRRLMRFMPEISKMCMIRREDIRIKGRCNRRCK